MVNRDDKGISDVIDQTLIIALVLALAVIVAVLVFGVFKPIDKTAYLVPRFGVGNASGSTVITIFDRGGDPIYFNNASTEAKYRGVLYVDTQSGSFRAVTAPTLTVFRPGDTIYAYYTGSGFVLTDTLSGVTFLSLPGGKITVRLVDATSDVLIASEDLVLAATTATATTAINPTPTTTPTTNVTTTATTVTPTTNVTTTATTTAIVTTTAPATTAATATTTVTATTTTPPVPLGANFNWARSGASGNVRFTDASTGGPTSWSWIFADGATSTNQHPVHRFAAGASYDVSLTIRRSSDGATSSITKTITV